jgi:flagellar protein FlgJ
MTTGGLSYDDLLSLLVFGGMPLPTGQAGIGQAGSGISEAEPAGLTTGPAAGLLPVPAAPKAAEPGKPVSHEDFLSSLLPMAESAGAEIGIDPKMLVAQAALETGWGRHMAGRNNLFNIKAGRGWSGDTSEVSTTEYRDGAPAKERAKFRAYESPEESFADYARLITGSKRYEGALASSGDPERYIRNIHNAGYATDPEYADKVLRIYRSIT